MIPLWRWFLHGEDVGARLLLASAAGTSYVMGSGWRPEDPVWWAAGIGVVLAAAASRKADPPSQLDA